MNTSAEDVKACATDLKVATEKVVATRKGFSDYQNALIELYDALDTVTPALHEEHEELLDTVNKLFEKVSEMVGMEDQMFFGNREEQSATDIISGLNEIAESGGIKESEEEL